MAEVEAWSRFTPAWNAILSEFGLQYFRMSEFAHSVSQFKTGWKNNESKRRALLNRLIPLILDTAKFWAGICVSLEDYQRADADWELHENAEPYPLCGRGVVDATKKWYDAHHYDCPLENIFEDGDENQGQLIKLVKDATGESPVFIKKQLAPLQAADFAAYETMKAYSKLSGPVDQVFDKLRACFLPLFKLPVQFGQFEEHNLRVLCRVFDFPRRRKD